MSFCSNCGNKLPENAKFCANCGTAINAPPTPQPNENQRKEVYDGVIHKCPACGETWNSFSLTCPSCGYELRDGKATSSVSLLAQKLENLTAKRQNTFGDTFLKILNKKKIDAIDEQKINLIQNFPIPNTKEDLIEFLILANSNLKALGINQTNEATQTAFENVWKMKREQAYQKAKISFSNTPDFDVIQELYTGKPVDKNPKKSFWEKLFQ